MLPGKIFACLLFFIMATSCSSLLYTGTGAIEKGTLTPAALDSLRSYLAGATPAALRDTLIIKYEFNHETCWDLMDRRPDSVIMRNVVHYQQYMQTLAAARPQAGIFLFREPGNDFNKIKSFNNQILIDNGYLKNLFFRKKATCGSSVIVDPEGNYLVRKSDSHFESLHLSQAAFAAYFR